MNETKDRYRYTSAADLAKLFLARVESGIGDTLELKEEIEERDWPAKQQWNRIIEDAAKKITTT
jgi:hypothetical protein